ncbi:putative histone-lysine N-methyltransferase PRDM6 isoform X2 [Bolinopsis microptera]|uniref:putative histone-lysine N-methyltransferase PRDM6 isoform X2 n=1 Tax=Bolinopsis microptera TaxID=2820187 RepID=UPI0030799727
MKISRDLLMYFLYGRDEADAIKDPLPILDTLPSDITIGHSMIPGAKYGVFARQHILRGLVVGPLNLPLGQSKEESGDAAVKDELAIHKSWSWLKYIQPARHPYEENARIDQTTEGIFLRITHDISPGCEILAWYADSSLSTFGMDISYSSVSSTTLANGTVSPGSSTSPLQSAILMSSPPKEKSSPPPSLSPGSQTSLLASLSAHKPVLSPPNQMRTSPLVPHKPILSPTPLPHKPLVSPQPLPHNPLISHPQLLAKAVCRLCGELYSSYVELWAHVTTAHASSSPLSRATSQIPATTPTTILSNSALPYPLPILPLNLGLPALTKPYPLLSPRMTELLEKTSPDPFLPEGELLVRECRDTERPYECGHCGKSFSLPSSLRRHIITHTGERPYKCGYCGRAFAGATTLNNHIRIHTGEKPHVCHDCGAGFTQATQLNRHIRCCPNSKNSSASNTMQHPTEIYVS